MGQNTEEPQSAAHVTRATLQESDYDRNVFVMIRYADTPALERIETEVRTALADAGLQAHLAKDRSHVPTHKWENIRFCMEHCRYGVAIYEQLGNLPLNPNISLELGYMLGRGKQCLILRDANASGLPGDLDGWLYKEIDLTREDSGIADAVRTWVSVDLRLDLRAAKIRAVLARIMAGRSKSDKAQRKILWVLHANESGIAHPDLRKACWHDRHDTNTGNRLRVLCRPLQDQGIIETWIDLGGRTVYRLTDLARRNWPSPGRDETE